MEAGLIQRVIDVLGGEWVAKDNHISATILKSGTMAFMGIRDAAAVIEEDDDLSSKTEPQLASLAPPPSKVDWRNNNGNYVTEIKYQGACGSCVAFAVCAMLESRVRILRNDPNLEIDLSEAHLFSCGCTNCCDTGWHNQKALKFAKKKGIGLEKDFPYKPGNQPCPKPPLSHFLKVKSYSAIKSNETRRRIIATKGPVVASMQIYDDFRNYAGGIYSHVTGSLIGHHAVCIVGYDHDDKYWIVKNSWNTSWGDNGFFKIKYDQCEIDKSFAFYDADIVFAPANLPSANNRIS
ncbi:C1 family peptidase [Methylobacterium tarhaniae]|uniref:C1 family peptidase n=1 Tax=Methylobacterium tarhaniae TaxID=1187852 RepID=UPI0009F81437|nr:C1 family peptidase [Methylobacterium tarhaniae]